jgi:hypothetical protein
MTWNNCISEFECNLGKYSKEKIKMLKKFMRENR